MADCAVSDAEYRRRVRAGQWRALRRGVIGVLPPDAPDVLDACAAVLLRPGHLVSHRSAALLHELPTFGRINRPELSRSTPAYSRGDADLVVRTARIPDADRTTWFGVPVTAPARTAVDSARISRRGGIMAVDAALRLGLASADDLAAVLDRAGTPPGIVQAREIVGLADGRAESPLESLTRLMLVDGGLPTFELQVPVAGYRVDFLLRAQRLIVEADGRVKYAGDELWQEKLRQEYLERAGYRVVRVLWDDVANHPDQTIARIKRQLRLL